MSHTCPSCSYTISATDLTCKRCRAPVSVVAAGGSSAENEAVSSSNCHAAPQTPTLVDDDEWKEVFDVKSGQIYYYNVRTLETSWKRPSSVKRKIDTGWIGRSEEGDGRASAAEQKKAEKRMAVVQVKETSKVSVEGNQNYNIWHDKYRGENWSTSSLGNAPAPYKCSISLHAGLTKADLKPLGSCYFCIQFARGKCSKGPACTYYHRVPTVVDEGLLDKMRDCFGRERHKDWKDDMSGAGSYNKPSRTLYVGRLRIDKHGGDEPTKNAILQHFEPFGTIENVNLIPKKAIAFVRYRLRSNAEFAKEAMLNQSLGKDEVLNVRWAYDDPNPAAVAAAAKADAEAVIAAMRARGAKIGEDGDESEGEGFGDGKRSKKKMKLGGCDAEAACGHYPNTDGNFNDRDT